MDQHWANEKPTLDFARRLRGIHFIDREDGAYKETLKNARRKLEVPMDSAMSCKKGTKKHFPFQETEAKRLVNPTRFQKQNMHVSWRRTSPRDDVWNHHYRKIMKITSKAKHIIQ